MKGILYIVVLSLALLSHLGCRRSSSNDDDNGTEQPTRTDEDSDSSIPWGTDPGTDTALPLVTDMGRGIPTDTGDGPADTDSTGATETSAVSDTGIDTSAPPPKTVTQPPMVIQVENNTSTVKYLRTIAPVRAEYDYGTRMEEVYLESPSCMSRCPASPPDDTWDCCMMCGEESGVLVILPGEHISYEWPGSLYSIDNDACACGCYYETELMAGDYLIYVEAYDDTFCNIESCEVEKSGTFSEAVVTGESTRYETAFSPAYEESVLSVIISDGTSSTDTDTDTETGIGTDSDVRFAHPPLTVRITNSTGSIKYLPGLDTVKGHYNNPALGTHESVRLRSPYCRESCETAEEGSCCISCEQWLQVVAILPGESVDWEWDGHLYEIDWDACDSCGCYYDENPFSGDYLLTVDAYDEATCFPDDTCNPPDATGPIWEWEVDGFSIQYEVPLTVPSEVSLVTIDINDVWNTRCDDGTELLCDMDVPRCDDDTFPAVQEECWRCVNLDCNRP